MVWPETIPGGFGTVVNSSSDIDNFTLPEPTEGQLQPAKDVFSTHYYLGFAEEVEPVLDGANKTRPIRDENSKSLGVHLTTQDWCRQCALQGSCLVRRLDGSEITFTYATRGEHQGACPGWESNPNIPEPKKTESTVFTKSDVLYGYGTANTECAERDDCENEYVVVPFRTIAVDGIYIEHGKLLYIPSARGVQLPDGSIHDGYFFSADSGGAIKDEKIDTHVGRHRPGKKSNPFPHATSSKTEQKMFKIHVVNNPELRARMWKQHTKFL